jgi:hypothetical protein
VTADYDAAPRLYPKLGYAPDGRGVHRTAHGDVTYFTKSLLNPTLAPAAARCRIPAGWPRTNANERE